MKTLCLAACIVLAMVFVGTGFGEAADPVELRFIWYDDGEEGAVMRDLLDRFEADNPDIKVVMDIVAYKTILEQLPIYSWGSSSCSGRYYGW